MTAASAVLSGVPTGASLRRLRRRVLTWYRRRGRTLEIRATRDPYEILVAEVMAQQTQIGRVAPAWHAFLQRFPTVTDLAAAGPADVIRAWAGLGYNGRAVRLRRAAVAIVDRHGGRVPSDVEALQRLPGVGPYTARAVAATAFGRRVAPVDTNVRRVVGRIVIGHGHRGDPGTTPTTRQLQAAADSLVAPTRPAVWAHALMDLGASLCRPLPRCAACPARDACAYARLAGERTLRSGAASAGRRRAVTAPRPAAAAPPFESTTRWLRGRLLAGLRDAEDTAWVAVPDRVGRHERNAIEAALDSLRRDGLVERADDGRARLPTRPGRREDGPPALTTMAG